MPIRAWLRELSRSSAASSSATGRGIARGASERRIQRQRLTGLAHRRPTSHLLVAGAAGAAGVAERGDRGREVLLGELAAQREVAIAVEVAQHAVGELARRPDPLVAIDD